MILAAKVWTSKEPEPEGLFNKAMCPAAPPNWFREDPEYAAELFGLELGVGDHTVNVLDTAGVHHRYDVSVAREIHARVRCTQGT